MNAIKLNPSQTLRLVDERKKFFANCAQNANNADGEKTFSIAPLICVLEERFSLENFRALKRLSIYKIKKIENAFFFPCKIELPRSEIFAPLPCATQFKNNFSLEDFFLEAKKIARNLESISDENDFLFAPTSLKFCQAEFNKNTWQLHDEVWKKIK